MKIKKFFIGISSYFKRKFNGVKEIIVEGDYKVSASMIVMGLGQLLYKQWIKGILYLLCQILFFLYFIGRGAHDIFSFFTLGSVESNEWYGITTSCYDYNSRTMGK